MSYFLGVFSLVTVVGIVALSACGGPDDKAPAPLAPATVEGQWQHPGNDRLRPHLLRFEQGQLAIRFEGDRGYRCNTTYKQRDEKLVVAPQRQCWPRGSRLKIVTLDANQLHMIGPTGARHEYTRYVEVSAPGPGMDPRANPRVEPRVDPGVFPAPVRPAPVAPPAPNRPAPPKGPARPESEF